MRLITFQKDSAPALGAMAGEYAVDLPLAAREAGIDGLPPDIDMLSFLRLGETAAAAASRAVEAIERELEAGNAGRLLVQNVIQPLSSVRLMAPIPNPSKVVAIGLNYRDHAREQGTAIPERPLIFAKFPTSVIGPGDTIVWDPELTQRVDFEAELAFVVGKTARRVPESDAYAYIAGYTCGNDVSARDLQFGDQQWVRGKSLDTFCPLGPALVTRDEIADPHRLAIRSVLNGEVMQDSNTSELIFGVPELLSFISRAFTLLPGDVVMTGTPHGVGVFRNPPVFLKEGDRIAIEIEGVGRLENGCQFG